MKEFNEEFPSLKEWLMFDDGVTPLNTRTDGMWWIRTDKIQEHCLDKERVRKVIDKHMKDLEYSWDNFPNEVVLASILKELGL